MELNDILALAKAGFNSQQIVALAGIGQQSTPPTQEVTQVPQAPTAPQYTQPTPAPQMGLMPQPQTVTTAPATSTAYQDPILAKLTELTSAVQANAIIGTGMPSSQPETPEDILAQIINPPSVVDPLKGGNK